MNLVATLALVVWPIVSLALFATRPAAQAILWTFLGAHMLLPQGTTFKIPVVPPFDKTSVPTFVALLGCWLMVRRRTSHPIRFGIVEIMLGAYVVVPFVSALMNGDTLVFGDRVLPGTSFYDGGSAILAAIVTLIPFWLGRRFLNSSDDLNQIFRALVIAGLVYSVLLLFEIRFSPQLHLWVYGYYPSDFVQAVRSEGFRPMAFMGHGLIAAFFLMATAVAAAALWKLKSRVFSLPVPAPAIYLTTVLLLCRSAGAAIYGIILVPLVRFGSWRLQTRIAAVLVFIALLYPALRLAGVFPTNAFVSSAEMLSSDRAASLQFRFDNEDILLARAWERAVFGWGRFGRGRVYDEEEGRDLSVTDGRWIITMGQFGLLGFLIEFGLLALPVFLAASSLKSSHSRDDQVGVSALALIVAISAVDLIPNGFLYPWTWLLAGALLGRAETLKARQGLRTRVRTGSQNGAEPVSAAGRATYQTAKARYPLGQ